MLKNKLLAFGLVVTMLFFNTFAYAANNERDTYTSEQLIYIYNTYFNNRNNIEKNLCNDDNFQYWNMIEDTEEKEDFSWFIDASAAILEVKPDEQKYIEILSGIIYMQEASLAQQIANQTQFDDVKGDFDYAMDFIGLGTSLFGISGSDIAENISDVVDVVADGGEMLAKNSGQAKYYLSTVQSYTQMMYLLESIEKNAQTPQLRDAAKELKTIGNSILQKRLEYISASGENVLSYEVDFFKDNLFWDLIKNTNDYKTDKTVQWFVDGAENIAKNIAKINSIGDFVFDGMILIGDLAFGTTNTFTRYQEMKAMADIAQALETSVSDLAVGSSPDVKTIGNIGTKCNYYNSLISVHVRGEYLVYSLLTKDAGLASNIKQIVEMFKDYEDTTQAWYDGKIQNLSLVESSVKEILNVPYCETAGEKPQLFVYDKDDAHYYNYHCKIERGTIDEIVNIDGNFELAYKTIKEFDVTEETTTILEDLVESPSDKAYTYKITVSDLSKQPGTIQTKHVTVSHNSQNTLDFYTDFNSNNIEKAYNELLDRIKPLNYALYDIDKDGSSEIITMFPPQNEEAAMSTLWYANVYTYKNAEIVKLSNEIGGINLYEFNGQIICDSGEGGQYGHQKIIYDRYALGWFLDSDLTENVPKFYVNGKEVSEKEYDSYISQLKPINIYEESNREPLSNL